MQAKQQTRVSNELKQQLRIIKKLLTYRFKAQRYTFSILKEQIKQIHRQSYDALTIYDMLSNKPFFLLDQQINYLEQYIFSCKPTPEQQVSQEHLLKHIQKMLFYFQPLNEQQEEKRLNTIISYVNKSYHKLCQGFKKSKHDAGFNSVTLDMFETTMKNNGFNKELIEILLEELSLESPEMNRINIDYFFYHFYETPLKEMPEDKRWLENINDSKQFKQYLLNSKKISKKSQAEESNAKLSTNSENMLKQQDHQNQKNDQDNIETNINLEYISSVNRLKQLEQLPKQDLNQKQFLQIQSKIIQSQENQQLFKRVEQKLVPQQQKTQIKTQVVKQKFQITNSFKKKLFDIKKLLTYRLKAKRINLYELVDSIESPCTSKTFIKFLTSEPLKLNTQEMKVCLQYIYQDYNAIKSKSLPNIEEQQLQKFFEKMIDKYNIVSKKQLSTIIAQIQYMPATIWMKVIFDLKNNEDSKSSTIKYDTFAHIMKKHKFSERQYELILQRFSLQTDNIYKMNVEQLAAFLIDIKQKLQQVTNQQKIIPQIHASKKSEIKKQPQIKKQDQPKSKIQNKKNTQQTKQKKFFKQPKPQHENPDAKTIEFQKQYKTDKTFLNQLRRMKKLLTYRLKAQKIPFHTLEEKLNKKLKKLKQVKYPHAIKLFEGQPFYLTQQCQKYIIFKYIFEDDYFAQNSQIVSIDKEMLIQKKMTKLVQHFDKLKTFEQQKQILEEIKYKVEDLEQVLRNQIQSHQTEDQTMNMDSFVKILEKYQFTHEEIEICLEQLSLVSDDMENLLPEALFQRFLSSEENN